jgi:hypothetical protein
MRMFTAILFIVVKNPNNPLETMLMSSHKGMV